MASYRLGGNLKINDAALNRVVENGIARFVRSYKKAGEKANKEIRQQGTKQWFSQAGFPLSWRTMYEALDFSSTVKQTNGMVYLYFDSFVNSDNYEITHTRLYQRRYKYNNLDAFSYIVVSLQWNRGIIGLPRHSDFGYSEWSNTRFHQTIPLQEYMKNQYDTKWIDTVRKYL